MLQTNLMTALVHDIAHPPLDHTYTCTLKVVAQRPVKPLPIQQKFLVHLQVLAVPVHLPGCRHGRLVQGPAKARMPQALQHPLRNAFNCRETAPLRYHRHRVAQPPQANGRGGTRRAGPQYHNARFRHGWHLVAQGR
ncbi:hypothetical protein D3C76_1193210 [compost metagenome]